MTDTLATVTALARAFVGDRDAVFDDPYWIPLVNAAGRDLVDRLEGQGIVSGTGVQTLLAFPAGTVAIAPGGGANQLASDCLLPLDLEERMAGSTDLYVPMRFSPFAPIPDRPQEPALGDWAWYNQGISLVGALNAVDLRITYLKTFNAFTAPGTVVPIQGTVNFLAYYAAALHCSSKDPGRVENCLTFAGTSFTQLARVHTRSRQRTASRRAPFGFRGRT